MTTHDMLIRQCVEGKIALHELKPIIESNRILFPVSVCSEFIEEDGRSVGYPVDEGWITEIEYDFTVGSLTDDTIAMALGHKEPTAPSQGVDPIDSYDYSDEELDSWRQDLDVTWAETEYNEWLRDGLVKESDSKEGWIANCLNNYHCWPREWKQKYDDAMESLNAPKGEMHVVLTNGKLTLYSDGDNYYFSTEHHEHGKLTKADKVSALNYIESFEIYQKASAAYDRIEVRIKDNLRLLKDTLVVSRKT